MLNIAIVDDEGEAVRAIHIKVNDVLKKLGLEFSIHDFTSGKALIEQLELLKPDLLFMDIDMPDITGIDIAAKIRMYNLKTAIVFVSCHSNFVFESIKYAPFRFIRKEMLETEIAEAINSFYMDMIKSNQLFQFELHDNTMIFEDISRIIYFFSIRHDIYFYTEQNTHRLSYRFMTMEELETKLFPWGYIRIHKTFLVNFRFIYQIQESSVILDEGSQRITLPISRRRISAVKKQYHQLLREGDAL